MISCSSELAIELLTAVLFVILAMISPKKAAGAVGLISIGGSYLRAYGFRTPLSVVHGDQIVGKSSMNAVVHHRISPHGITIAEVPIPIHLPTQLLVRVTAASLRASEVQGKAPFVVPWVRHLWKVGLGSDVAGQVVSVGKSSECAFVQVGDSIFGTTTSSLAEYAVVACDACAKRPHKLSHAQAAALPGMLLPIMAAFDYAEIERKKKHDRSQTQSLSHLFGKSYGGAGAMLAQNFLKFSPSAESQQGLGGSKMLLVVNRDSRGLFTFAIAKAMGAEITVAAQKEDLKAFSGAKHVFDYEDLSALSKLYSSGGEFDVIVDVVTRANHSDNPPSFRAVMASGGVYVMLNQPATPFWLGALRPFVGFAVWLRGGALEEDFHSLLRKPPAQALNRLARWFEEGAISAPLVEDTVAVTSNILLWQTFARMKAGQGRFVPVFTFPIEASAM